MPVDFAKIVIGQEYDRPDLAKLWNYETFHAFSRGVFTPRDQKLIVLFISHKHQTGLPQYDNRFDGELLWMDGENGHKSDKRLANSPNNDQVHLFYRNDGRSSFRYCGEVVLLESFLVTGDATSRFVFTANKQLARDAETVVATEFEQETSNEPEGKRLLRLHVVYERSKQNRDEALRIHLRKCVVCHFDFDAVYGADLGGSYVEVHHCRSITEIKGEIVDPKVDLAPLCANCHRMAHRRRGQIVSLEELRERVRRFAGWPFSLLEPKHVKP